MRSWQERQSASEIKDPRLEFARQAEVQNGLRLASSPNRRGHPPQVVDSDFCYSEETKR